MKSPYITLSAFLLILFSYNHTVFGYTLLRGDWSYYADPMGESVMVYENTSDTTGVLNAILNAMNTWNNAGARFKFTYGGIDTKPVPNPDNVNQIRWDQRDGDYFLAQASMMISGNKIIEADIVFNDRYLWATGSYIPSGSYDVESVALHELGHVLGLDHYYAPAIMQGTIGSGVKRRALTTDDINGILALYGSNGAIDNPPFANAGLDQSKISGETVQLDGSQSYDPDNDPLSYQWRQISGPVASLSDATAVNPTFIAPSVTAQTTLIFELTVTARTLSSTDSVQITVQPVSTPPSDTTPPSVSITSPINGALVNSRSLVLISASAADDRGVARVEFYVNGSLKGVTTFSPYTYSWKVPVPRNKTYYLTARAYDAAGNIGSSNTVVVTSR